MNRSLNYLTEFQDAARFFVKQGADCVCLYEGDAQVAIYPAGGEKSSSPIIVSSEAGITLEVHGAQGAVLESAAQIVVDMFARLVKTEDEFDSLTAALVEMQDRLVALYDLSNAARRVLDIPLLLELMTKEISDLFEHRETFTLFAQLEQPSVARQNFSPPLPEHVVFLAGERFAESWHNDPGKDPILLQVGSQPVMMFTVPVCLGVFAAVGIQAAGKIFTMPDIKLIRAITAQTGAQLENALHLQEALARTRLETELTLVQKVQTALLPHSLPVVQGVDFFATSRPAYEAGGDFFDLVATENRPFTFMVGDVTGKGLPAALLMGMTRALARSAARNMPFTRPSQVMERLNFDMFDDLSSVGMFTTAFIGVFDPADCRLAYCNAGQSPIIYVPFKGHPKLLEATDMPIGIFDYTKYHTETLDLKSGDIVVAATDGFPESRNVEGSMFGYEKLIETILEVQDQPAKSIVDRIFQRVEGFSGSHPQDDDCTIIVCKVL